MLGQADGEGSLSRSAAPDLQEGQRVRAWHTGVLTKSYPGRGTARVIVIGAAGRASAPEVRGKRLLRDPARSG